MKKEAGNGFRIRQRKKTRKIISGLLCGSFILAGTITNAWAQSKPNTNKAQGKDAAAVGEYNEAKGKYTSAIGSWNKALYDESSAIGYYNTAQGHKSSALGTQNTATGAHASAYGAHNVTSGNYATAIGHDNDAVSDYSLALGRLNVAKGFRSAAIGADNNANCHYSVAIGLSNTVLDERSYAIGGENEVKAKRSGIFGYQNKITDKAANSYIIGVNSSAEANGTIIIGNNARGTHANSLVLGSDAVTSDVHVGKESREISYIINGQTYQYGFAGHGQAANGSVTFGAKGKERQVHHVAAGEIKNTSTDAVNGSQLYSTNSAVQKIADTLGSPTLFINGVSAGQSMGQNIDGLNKTIGASKTGKYIASGQTVNDNLLVLDSQLGDNTKKLGEHDKQFTAHKKEILKISPRIPKTLMNTMCV